MIRVALRKELEGIVDEMVDDGSIPEEIIDCCKTAVIESLLARNKPVPAKISKLDMFR
jgi:hypothetical protein